MAANEMDEIKSYISCRSLLARRWRLFFAARKPRCCFVSHTAPHTHTHTNHLTIDTFLARRGVENQHRAVTACERRHLGAMKFRN